VATNQVSGRTYDAAGNVTSDGQNSYQYDAEGNLIQAVNSLQRAQPAGVD
jgi:YD repeat-containing protein